MSETPTPSAAGTAGSNKRGRNSSGHGQLPSAKRVSTRAVTKISERVSEVSIAHLRSTAERDKRLLTAAEDDCKSKKKAWKEAEAKLKDKRYRAEVSSAVLKVRLALDRKNKAELKLETASQNCNAAVGNTVALGLHVDLLLSELEEYTQNQHGEEDEGLVDEEDGEEEEVSKEQDRDETEHENIYDADA